MKRTKVNNAGKEKKKKKKIGFPFKNVFSYLDDMKLREKNIREEVGYISQTREYVEKVLECLKNELKS